MRPKAKGDPAAPNVWTMTVRSGPRRVPDCIPPSVDWMAERDKIDLAEVIARETGQRPITRNGRAWFVCPFHHDTNPSLVVRTSKTGSRYCRCYSCGAQADAAGFIMRLRSVGFPEAIGILTGGPTPPPTRPGKAAARPAVKPPPPPSADPTGLPEDAALALVDAAEARLWSSAGADALAYLAGPRCLGYDTIRAARLGWVDRATIPTRDGDRWFSARGCVVPWFHRGRLALVKIRQPDGRRPKYAEAFRVPARVVCYPGFEAIRPGRPLVVVEGEFDALALGEALGELAAVITTGSASSGPPDALVARMRAAARWYAAHDHDPAGDKAAASWPARALRVRPPGSFKDWTEAKAAGVDLARWWRDILAGVERPALFSWDELAAWRWGGADAPGIIMPAHRPVAFAQAVEP